MYALACRFKMIIFARNKIQPSALSPQPSADGRRDVDVEARIFHAPKRILKWTRSADQQNGLQDSYLQGIYTSRNQLRVRATALQ